MVGNNQIDTCHIFISTVFLIYYPCHKKVRNNQIITRRYLMEFKRERYLKKLNSSIGNGMVKIITGPRRSGKSYLLFHIFKDHLLKSGVREDHIIELKLDHASNIKYRNLNEFTSYFKERRIDDDKTNFFLIDEIQLVEKKENPYVKGQMISFYDSLNEFMDYGNTEIFVTGSNSHMLSSDIATEFRGRGWQIRMNPLSFSEIREETPLEINDFSLWDTYWKYGGLPYCALEADEEKKRQYLNEVFLTTYLKDIADRNGLKDDIALKEITSFLASSVGSLLNPTKISNTFKSKESRNISSNTVSRYISYLEDAFMIDKVQRYDLKGKEIINGSGKYYFADMGIRNAAAFYKGYDQEPHFMENIIYNELISRGYLVNIGAITNVENVNGKPTKVTREVDFIIEKYGKRFYIQSAYLIDNEEKLKQEKESFKRIKDTFQRVIITKYTSGTFYDEDGTLRIGLFDFLLGKDTNLI